MLDIDDEDQEPATKEVEMKRLLLLVLPAVVAVGALAFTLAPTAAAQQQTGQVDLAGAGVLRAAGTGFVHLQGAMDFRGSADAGALVVHDRGGNALIEVQGYGQKLDLADGGIAYLGFHGTAHIRGRDVQVDLLARGALFRAIGKGNAFLDGRGWYSVNGLPAQPWSEPGVGVQLAS
jgi:hypothetical protein